jgi:hypothetical protein
VAGKVLAQRSINTNDSDRIEIIVTSMKKNVLSSVPVDVAKLAERAAGPEGVRQETGVHLVQHRFILARAERRAEHSHGGQRYATP